MLNVFLDLSNIHFPLNKPFQKYFVFKVLMNVFILRRKRKPFPRREQKTHTQNIPLSTRKPEALFTSSVQRPGP
jgi:hypothetical protein